MEFDPLKNATNLAKHGVSFEEIDSLDWSAAVTLTDDRFDYGEERKISYVTLEGRLHILVWTQRDEVMRPISFRKANKRERDDYEKDKNART